MKFVCEKCKTKYSIADEKVRGKVLKIRCKNCANIIVVREAAQQSARRAAAAGGGSVPAPSRGAAKSSRKSSLDAAFDGAFSASPSPSPPPPAARKRRASRRLSPAPLSRKSPAEEEFDGADDSTSLSAAPDIGGFEPEATRLAPPPQPDLEPEPEDEWFLAVDGSQYGPMTFAELCSRVKRGEARSESGEEAYCWRDGFDDWVEVTSVPELRPYAPPPPPPTRSRSGLFPVGPGGPPPSPAEQSQQVMLPPMPSVPSLPGGPAEAGRPDTGMGLRPRLDSTGGGMRAPAPPMAPPGATPTPAPAPRPPTPAAPLPAPAGVAVAPPAPAQQAAPEIAAAMESGLRALPAAYSEAPVGPGAAAAMQPVAPASSKTPLSIKIAAVGGIVSTLTGLAILVYFLAFDRPNKPESGSAKVAAKAIGEQPKRPVEKPEVKPDAGAVASAFPPMEVGRSGDRPKPTGTRRRVVRKKTGKKLSAEEKRLLAIYGKTSAGGTLPSGLVKKRARKSGRKLKASDVRTVHQRNARGLKVCYERAAKRDNTLKNVRVDVTLGIAGSGKVRRVNLKFSGGKSVDLKSCLMRNLSRWVFHGASAQNIAFPLIFRGS